MLQWTSSARQNNQTIYEGKLEKNSLCFIIPEDQSTMKLHANKKTFFSAYIKTVEL